MKILLDMPDEFNVTSLTVVASSTAECSVFTHCFKNYDGATLKIEKDPDKKYFARTIIGGNEL